MNKILLAAVFISLINLTLNKNFTTYNPSSLNNQTRIRLKQKHLRPSCPLFSSFIPKLRQCQCWQGYQKGTRDNCIPICSVGWKLDSQNQLACIRICQDNNIYIQSTNECLQCPEYSQYELKFNKCLCIDGYQILNDQCVKVCQFGTLRNGLQCVPIKNKTQEGNTTLNSIKQVVFNNIQENNTSINNSENVVCQQNSEYNRISKQCECFNNYQKNSTGQCIPKQSTEKEVILTKSVITLKRQQFKPQIEREYNSEDQKNKQKNKTLINSNSTSPQRNTTSQNSVIANKASNQEKV